MPEPTTEAERLMLTVIRHNWMCVSKHDRALDEDGMLFCIHCEEEWPCPTAVFKRQFGHIYDPPPTRSDQ